MGGRQTRQDRRVLRPAPARYALGQNDAAQRRTAFAHLLRPQARALHLGPPAGKKRDDLAFDATIRAAAPFQRPREELKRNKVAFAVRPSDYYRKVRVRRAANLVLFLVDASWSMAVAERMVATKGAIMSLLNDAYQRRDRVGLVSFQRDRATLVLPPTNSVLMAERASKDIPVGGKTPLSATGSGLRRPAPRKNPSPRCPPPVHHPHRWRRQRLHGSPAPARKNHAAGLAMKISDDKVHSVVINIETSPSTRVWPRNWPTT